MARGSIKTFRGVRGPSYRVTVDVGKHPDGSRHQIRRSFPTRKQADAFLTQTLNAVRSRTFSEPSTEPLGAYLEKWIDASAVRGVKPATQNKYDAVRANRWGPLAAVPLRDLTTAQIEARMATELANGIAPSTVRVGLTVLRAALEDAVERGELARNPAKLAPMPKLRKPPVKAWTVEEAERVLAAIRAEPLWAWQETLVSVMLETGLRVGEMVVLTWADVDLDSGKIAVSLTQTCRRDGTTTIGPAKRDASVRDLKLSRFAVENLRRHRLRQKETKLGEGPEYNVADFVFPSVRGGMQARNRISEMLKAASKRANVPILTSHGIRHTSATISIRRGIPLNVVSERLGHSSPVITYTTYIHPNARDHQDAADTMGEAFGGERAAER